MIFTTAILGGITGLIGSIVAEFGKAKKAKADLEVLKETNRSMESMADKENARLEKIAQIDADKDTYISDNDLQGKSYEVFTTSMTTGAKLTGWKLGLATCVDAFNNLVRSCATIYYQLLLGTLCGYCIYYLDKYAPLILSQDSTRDKMLALIFSVVDMILFQSSMSLGWWFGVRGMALKGKK